MKKGIITDNWDECFNCGSRYMLECHHAIHGTANRKLADKYGLIVPMCHICHCKLHDYDTSLDKALQRYAQEKFEQKYPNISFRQVFGRNYKYE